MSTPEPVFAVGLPANNGKVKSSYFYSKSYCIHIATMLEIHNSFAAGSSHGFATVKSRLGDHMVVENSLQINS